MESTTGIIGQFFPALGEVVEGVLAVIASLFEGVLELFWTTSGFTTMGYILLAVVGAPLVMWGVRFIINLIKSIKVNRG